MKPVYFEGELIGHAYNITQAKRLANSDLKQYAAPGEDDDLPLSTFKAIDFTGPTISLVIASV